MVQQRLVCNALLPMILRVGLLFALLDAATIRVQAFQNNLVPTKTCVSRDGCSFAQSITRHGSCCHAKAWGSPVAFSQLSMSDGNNEGKSDDRESKTSSSQPDVSSGAGNKRFWSRVFGRVDAATDMAEESLKQTESAELSDTVTTTTAPSGASDDQTSNAIEATPGSVVTEETPSTTVVEASSTVEESEQNTVEDQARTLKLQAEKVRLEAERMDAELTLQKIAKLEKELQIAKTKGTDTVDSLQREMDALQLKLAPPEISTSVGTSKPTSTVETASAPSGEPTFRPTVSVPVTPFDQQQFDEIESKFMEVPEFMRKLIARSLQVEPSIDGSTNWTMVVERLDSVGRSDFSFDQSERPSFTLAAIDEMKQRLNKEWYEENLYIPDDSLKTASQGNDTELALLCLEYEYYEDMVVGRIDDTVVSDSEVAEFAEGVGDFLRNSTLGSIIPKSMQKEDAVLPTREDVDILVAALAKTSFVVNSKPAPVPGGFVIQGKSNFENGEALVQAIDQQLKATNLQDKMTVFALDEVVAIEVIVGDDPGTPDDSMLLLVAGTDVARKSRPVLLGATSAVGLATCYYLALYPFLLNPIIGKRVDEQLALVDANMVTDMSWLNSLPYPLFATFVGIMLVHEAAHRVAAATSGMKLAVPTFVPSIITGVTTTVTSMKSPAKDNKALFDFAISGPLAGMLASLCALFVGTQLSITIDPATYPALPLEILRQSSLGAGVIESVLGNGVVGVPEGALGTEAVAGMTVPLHPFAVAGYIGLLVNALAMLPIGTTDGGRVAAALFGRSFKSLAGTITLVTLLVLGIRGSDLFLFYYAFCTAFQTGNEIPSRNEVDEVDFGRAIVGFVAYFVAILALVPVQ